MNITSTDTPRHSKEEAKADALELAAAQDTDKEITLHVHTGIPHAAILAEGQFTGYIILRS